MPPVATPDRSPAHPGVNAADAHRLLNSTLIQILQQPDSTAPYTRLMTDVIEVTGADAGALYLNAADTAVTAIAVVGDVTPYTDYVRGFTGVSASLEQPPPGMYVRAIPTGTSNDDTYLLLLAGVDIERHPDDSHEFLHILCAGLAAIFVGTRQARVKRRQDLYRERATISRELHDSLAQSLTYLKIQAARIQSMLSQEHPTDKYDHTDIDGVVQELRNNLNVAYRQLRELMTTFRLTMDGKNFGQAIEDSVGEFEKRSRIAFDLDNRIDDDELTVDEAMQVLHIVREALSNIVRHSHARRARVALHHWQGSAIRVSVDDDGVGIDKSQQREKHLGLIIMQERSRNLGGEFKVEEHDDGGTGIEITFTPQKSLTRDGPGSLSINHRG